VGLGANGVRAARYERINVHVPDWISDVQNQVGTGSGGGEDPKISRKKMEGSGAWRQQKNGGIMPGKQGRGNSDPTVGEDGETVPSARQEANVQSTLAPLGS